MIRIASPLRVLLGAGVLLCVVATGLTTASAARSQVERSAPAPERPPQVRFGLFADSQYCDCPNHGTRYYRLSLGKLADAAKTYNRHDLDFTVQLGDLIDRDLPSFDAILPVFERIRGTRYHVLGNHDFPVPSDEVVEILGMPGPYYDVSRGGWRFVMLDDNDISTYAHPPESPKTQQAKQIHDVLTWTGDVNAHDWNGGVGDEQLAWFRGVLDDAKAKGEKVLVFGHMPLYPVNEHNAWNDDALAKVIESSGNVVAYFSGHNHHGNYGKRNGVHYVTLQGMVELDTNAYAIVRLYDDRIRIDGHGREPDRVLRF